jgi:hypothetical protein
VLGVGVDELRVEEVVDKVGLKGVTKLVVLRVGGVAMEAGGQVEAAAAAAAAKAAAATKELCKKGLENRLEVVKPGATPAKAPRPPKVGLKMLSIEKAMGLLLLLSGEFGLLGRGKKG